MSGDLHGMLLGGAVGDALGAPVEFMSLREIRASFGAEGITDFAPAYGREAGAITDDTQMTLFVFEGLIRAQLRMMDRGICNPAAVINRALLRWAATQGIAVTQDEFLPATGWLFEQPELHQRRAPGMTCIESLAAHAVHLEPVNDSKGCGSVMRSAPFGVCNEGRAYELAAETSAFTHSHPVAGDASGSFAEICRILLEGASIREAVLRAEPQTEEVRHALDTAERFMSAARGVLPTPETLETLGEGWVAEEALGIGAACAMLAEDMDDGSNEDRLTAGVRLAVNHSGDSDSTGSIAGNLLGARYGQGAIPTRWLRSLEVRHIIDALVGAWESLRGVRALGAHTPTPEGEGDGINLAELTRPTLASLYQRFPSW